MFISAGAVIGHNFKVYNRVYLKLYNGAKLIIGDNFTLFSGESINPIGKNIKGCIFLDRGATLSIGHHVGMSSPTIWCSNNIQLHDHVRLGGMVTILDTDCHSLNYIDRHKNNDDYLNTKSKPVIIEEDVLVGAYTIILKGSHIGARTIIGAGSVVSGIIPSDCIAAGNPCKVIRYFNT
jgi:acetyltransferase-like isoleucine patch superfamily enzyme